MKGAHVGIRSLFCIPNKQGKLCLDMHFGGHPQRAQAWIHLR